MKKTQIKDATRNVKKNLLSWISVVFIAAMAAASYLGICYSAASMRSAGDSFYRSASFRDFEITSSLLLTSEDLDALLADRDVKDVEGVYFANAKVSSGDIHENVNVVSVSERINVPEIVQGALPQKDDECAVEQPIAEKLGYKVGDTVAACDDQGAAPKFLKGKEYKVTGIVQHPDHLAKPDYAPGNRYILVTPDAFDDEQLDGCFMRAEVVLKSTEGMSRFSDEYKKATDAAKERLTLVADERSALRTGAVKDKAQKKIDDGQQKLDEAKEKLTNGKKELDKGKDAIVKNEKKLADAKTELENGKQTLDSSKAKLDSAKATLSSTKNRLDAAESELYTSDQKLSSAKTELDANSEKLEAAKAELDANKEKLDEAEEGLAFLKEVLDAAQEGLTEAKSATPEELAEMTPEELELYNEILAAAEELYNEGLAAYNEGKQQFDDGTAAYNSAAAQYAEKKAAYDSAVEQYNNGKAQYEAGAAEYYAGLSQYEAGLAEYDSGKAQYDKGVADYNAGVQQYKTGLKELEKGKNTLADKEKEYKNGLAEYEKNVQKLEDAKADFAALKDCSWFVFDVGSNGGYMHLSLSAKSISNLSITFSLFFVVIAALVIYTTIKRIVDEQRNLVGATKALGFYNREILGKYLLFGITATIVGALIGILAGYFVIQGVVLNSYGNMYVIGEIPSGILIGTSVIAVVLAIALAVAAVTISCLSLMRSTAIELMKEKQPKAWKSSKKSGSAGRLYSKLIFRNMRSDLARVIVTTVSVAGCCALLVIGFTLRSSVSIVSEKQFGDIVKYDEKLTFNSAVSDDVEKELEAILDDAGTTYVKAHSGLRAFKAGGDVEYTDLICGDMEALSAYYNFRTWKEDGALPTDADGVFIQCRTTETTGKNAGDDIIIYDSTMAPNEVRVAGVFNNYLGRNMIMNEASYETYFGEKPVMNTYFLYLNGADKEKLVEKLNQVKGFESLSPAAEDKGKLEFVTNVFNKVAILLLVIAGLMAYFILLNITKMYVNQKTRELTIMRINGFTVKEVKRYLNTETIITSAVGILLGIGVGALMGYIVIRFIEMPHAQFVRDPFVLGWLISSAITAVFTIVITAFGTRKVKDLKLTDA